MADVRPFAYFRDGFIPFEEANLSIASAPVLYGLSVYTVFPVLWNANESKLYLFRLDDHFQRLQNSAKIMAFDDFLAKWNYDKFADTMRQLLLKNKVKEDCLVRVNVFVDESLKGTRMHGLKHSLSAFVYSTPPLLPKSGARLMVSNWRRTSDNSIPSRAKINGSYVNASLMKHEAMLSGFDDALALDDHGHVTEGTVANMFMVRGGRLITPHEATDLLEGITRDTVFKLADQLGIAHERRNIDRSELYLADEIFLCGSSVQITPVIEVDHRQIGSGTPGALTGQLMDAYGNVVNEASAFKDWLTVV
ncbi:MAG TPA: aminotransferase class IV [Candidatus Saccharimonadales bacterium]|jgi:branched-chain amino acid aminotransferase|nr:aminotransferase class IV [Candidatus Saccharimonadales bacterium]